MSVALEIDGQITLLLEVGAQGRRGETGAATSTYRTLADLQAAPVNNRVYSFVPAPDDTSGFSPGNYFFIQGDFSGPAFANDFVTGIKVELNDIPLYIGALLLNSSRGMTFRNRGDTASTRLLQDKVRERLSVDDYKLAPDADDTAACVRARDVAAPLGLIMELNSRDYIVDQIGFGTSLSLLGRGAKRTRFFPSAAFIARASSAENRPALLNFNQPVLVDDGRIGGFSIDLTTAPGKTGLFMFAMEHYHVEDITIDGGAIGLFAHSCGDSDFHRIRCYDQTDAMIRVNADGGAEMRFEDCLMRRNKVGTTERAFDYVRTNANDTGGLYLYGSRITCAPDPTAIINNGYYCVSSVPNTYAYFHFVDCIADNVKGTGALAVFKNLTEIIILGGHFAALTPQKGVMVFEGCQDVLVSNAFMDAGDIDRPVFTYGNSPVQNVRLDTNDNLINRGTMHWFADGAPVNGLSFHNRYTGLCKMTNNKALLASSLVEEFDGSPVGFLTDPDGGRAGAVRWVDARTGRAIYSRNSGGNRQSLNQDFAHIENLANNGDYQNYGKVQPGLPQGGMQTSAGIYAGNGPPNDLNGADGDFYLRGDGAVTGKTCIYHKEGGIWKLVVL